MSNTHNQTDREPVPTEFAVTLKALRTIAWAAGEVKTRAAIEDILANGIPPARASVKAARAADVDAATPASAAEAVPVARLKVYMDKHDMGQSLAPNPPYKMAAAHALKIAGDMPLGEYDLYTAPPKVGISASEAAPQPQADVRIGMKQSEWKTLSPQAQEKLMEIGRAAVAKYQAHRLIDAQARADMPVVRLLAAPVAPRDYTWLEAAIMNLPCRSPQTHTGYMSAYKDGHRDARHAAAELAQSHVADLERRNAVLVEAMAWQPIETAPKAGLIDIWIPHSDGGGIRWAGCYYDAICYEWRTISPSGHMATVPARSVSHWMPLPAPPSTGKPHGEEE